MTQHTIGVDVSKAYLDAHLLPAGETRRFANDPGGFGQFVKWIGNRTIDRIVYEPTAVYHRGFEDSLSAMGLPLARINPLRARRFAEACGRRAKTDRIDAEVLAHMGVALQPGLCSVPSKLQCDLKALQIARQALIKDSTAAKNRSGNLTLPMLMKQNANRLRQIKRDLQAIEKQMLDLIKSNDKLSRTLAILCSIPGISKITAIALIVEIPEIGTLKSKTVASLAGLAPFSRESGKWKGKAFTTGGRKPLRDALYMPALVALRFNPDMKAKYHDLKKAGKPSKVAVTAIMRKLIILANTLIKQDRIWLEKTS